MARLTKRKALKICYDLWIWLAKNPLETKKNWPGWKQYGKMKNICPCCEYDRIYGAGHCRKCPLADLWPLDPENGPNCTNEKSVYMKWSNALTSKSSEKYAFIIANAAKAGLDRLPKLKKERTRP